MFRVGFSDGLNDCSWRPNLRHAALPSKLQLILVRAEFILRFPARTTRRKLIWSRILLADTLPRENDDFNFSPSEPAAKTRRLMDGKPAPDLVLKFLGVKVCQ